MAEAQRLIGISLAKIAQSRVCRGGVSLHKNLLVATVLQKARYIFMEEAYHYFQQNKCFEMEMEKQKNSSLSNNNNNNNNDSDDSSSESEENDEIDDTFSRHDVINDKKHDKENKFPVATTSTKSFPSASDEPVYHDLDCKQDLSEIETESAPPTSNKRRREIAEWETEEAVLSILPKRVKSDEDSDDIYSSEPRDEECRTTSTFLEEATALSEAVAKEMMEQEAANEESELAHSPSVESIDRITSLVSLFGGLGGLTRSMSTPDFCAAQAKESDASITHQLQHTPRTFLTMTV